MKSKNETVEDIVSMLRRFANGEELPTDEMPSFTSLADRIETAHKREVNAILKDRDDMYKSEQETIAKTNAWFVEYQTLKREVAELRECVQQAYVDVCLKCVRNGRNIVCSKERQCERVKRWRKALERTSVIKSEVAK